MATIRWANAVDGNFDTVADWSTGTVPGRDDPVILGALDLSPYTVTASASETVKSMHIAANATLSITGGSFTLRGAVDNQGTIALDNVVGAATLILKGVVSNDMTGVISAGDGSKVVLVGAQIDQGALQSTGSGRFIVRTGESALIGGALLKENAPISVFSSASLLMQGNIMNTGEIDLSKSGSAALLIDGEVELLGDGPIHLSRGDSIVSADKGTLAIHHSTISGAGLIGDARMSLANVGGVIDASGRGLLTVNTGANIIQNIFGTIEATGRGRGLILSKINNAGTLTAAGGTLIFKALVGGTAQSGSAVINGGTLDFRSKFDENVAFTGASGVLKLADSRHYAAGVSGFSPTGGTSLDLKDIRFVSAGEATFSGSTTSGVLTVTDGHHTANITLIGDYTNSTFVVSPGHRGVTVVASAQTAAVAVSPPHRFISAMAGLAGSAGGAVPTDHAGPVHEPMLFKPRAMIA
jgi:hypothetical protein